MNGDEARRRTRRLGRGKAVVGVLAMASALVLVPISPATAADQTVTCEGEDQLQPALDQAQSGDTISIAEGAVCSGAFTMPTTNITLQGLGSGATLDGADNENQRILRADDVGATTIRNLVVRNGNYSGNGAGIKVQGASTVTIDNVRFFGNTAGVDGGGLAVKLDLEAGTTTIRNSTFGVLGEGGPNSAQDGGGLYVETDGPVTLTNNTFIGNQGLEDGGGVHIDSSGSDPVVVTGNTFTQNQTGDNGGGLDIEADNATVTGNTFTGNTAEDDGAGLDLQVGEGGASSATVTGNTFTDNESDDSGGGLFLDGFDSATVGGNTFTGNHADSQDQFAASGGGAYVEVNEFDDTLAVSGNTFTGNTTRTEGGGLFIDIDDDIEVSLTENRFVDNHVLIPLCLAGTLYGGGGLAVDGDLNVEPAEGDDGTPTVNQRGNTFTGNTVELDPEGCQSQQLSAQEGVYGEYYGGGEWVTDAHVVSVDDELIGNTVSNVLVVEGEQEGEGAAEGGGLAVQALRGRRVAVTATNLVLAGNEADGQGIGGGAYFGSEEVGVDIDLLHATVAANHADTTGGGLAGGTVELQDHLVLENSIVWGNTAGATEGEDDISGFGTVTANFSDVCLTAEQLQAGSGDNICADPLLVAPATGDVHQTSTSPTLDVAGNALSADVATDYEGQDRRQDANGDGPAPDVADMGADEFAEPAPPPPPEEDEDDLGIAPGSIGEDDGYCLAAEDGGVFTFGGCQFFGAAGGGRDQRVRAAFDGILLAPQSLVTLNAPVVSIAMVPADTGYWQAAADGGVFSFGTAQFFGSMGGTRLNNPIVGIASSPTGNGYWLVASDGGVFSFGDAPFLGSTGGIRLNSPIVGITATPSGNGYWLVASDGGVFSFGDAQFFGSAAEMKLNASVVGMGSRPGGRGYWLAAADGGVFTFGDAPFLGNRVGQPLNAPVIGIKSASSGNGYWLIAGDGGVFSFGTAPFLGSMGSTVLNQPVIDMTG